MTEDIERLAAEWMVAAIRVAFPEDAARVDAIVQNDFHDGEPFSWVERFSQQTTDAIKGRRLTEAEAHLRLVSSLLERDAQAQRCIDVAYVESLMWDIKDEKLLREGWKLIPNNLRTLYVAMWGEKPFMRGVK